MPSNLRLQLDMHSTQSIALQRTASVASPPAQTWKMSLTQTYRIASTARGKLGMEAARPDHDLRLLVGHANLLDTLLLELASGECAQEAWYNATVRGARKTESTFRHMQWIDSISEEADSDDIEDDCNDDDSSADSESDDECEKPSLSLRKFSDNHSREEELNEDYDEHLAELALERVHSHTPDLVHEHEDSEDSSDDECMPPSPPPLSPMRTSSIKLTTARSNTTVAMELADAASRSLRLGHASTPMIAAF